MNYYKVNSFIDKLKLIGVEVELIGNYPWVYLDKINGIKVREIYQANHGFTIFWLPIEIADKEVKWSSIRETFKLIRKYIKCK